MRACRRPVRQVVRDFLDLGWSGKHLVQVALPTRGVSPARYFRTAAQSGTASTRPLRRETVAFFTFQIGSKQRSTCGISDKLEQRIEPKAA